MLGQSNRLTINRPTFHSPDRVKVAKIVFFCYYHPTFHSSYLLRMQLSNHKRFIKTTPIFRKGKGRRFHTCADLRNITGSSSLNWTWRFCQFISIYRTIIFVDIVHFGKKSCHVIPQNIVHNHNHALKKAPACCWLMWLIKIMSNPGPKPQRSNWDWAWYHNHMGHQPTIL